MVKDVEHTLSLLEMNNLSEVVPPCMRRHRASDKEAHLERIEFSLMTNSILDKDVDDEYGENEEQHGGAAQAGQVSNELPQHQPMGLSSLPTITLM